MMIPAVCVRRMAFTEPCLLTALLGTSVKVREITLTALKQYSHNLLTLQSDDPAVNAAVACALAKLSHVIVSNKHQLAIIRRLHQVADGLVSKTYVEKQLAKCDSREAHMRAWEKCNTTFTEEQLKDPQAEQRKAHAIKVKEQAKEKYAKLALRRDELRAMLNLETIKDGGVASMIKLSISEQVQLVVHSTAYQQSPLRQAALQANARWQEAMDFKPDGYIVRGNPFMDGPLQGGPGLVWEAKSEIKLKPAKGRTKTVAQKNAGALFEQVGPVIQTWYGGRYGGYALSMRVKPRDQRLDQTKDPNPNPGHGWTAVVAQCYSSGPTPFKLRPAVDAHVGWLAARLGVNQPEQGRPTGE